jgi:putative ABC transport system substrate-binding protein
MKRRDFTTSLLLAGLARPTWAQQTVRQRRIAIVSAAIPAAQITDEGINSSWREFYLELRRLGFVEGENLVIDRFSAEGHPERYPDLASEIIKDHPDLIVSENNPIARTLGATTTAVPIISWMGDPIKAGIVTSLARPSGNITGVVVEAGLEIIGKRLQILKEAVPSAAKVAAIVLRGGFMGEEEQILREAASRLGVELIDLRVDESTPAEFRRLFTEAVHKRADALSVGPASPFVTYRQLIVELAEKYRLPAIYCYPDFVTVGGLMSYGPDLAELGRRVAEQVHRILSGSKVSEVPVYQADRFPLILNLAAARAIDFTFPPSLLGVADTVVE